jgi:hypothetical protein
MRLRIILKFSGAIRILILVTFALPLLTAAGNSKSAGDTVEDVMNELPTGFNAYFAGSGECALCHSSMVNNAGEPVSIINDWRSSMMASSSKDPFWRAKVSHETLVNPQHAATLEDVCTRCHAPMGHFNAHMTGQDLYSIQEMETDPLALDGASCTACHQITEESLGNFSGNMLIGEDKKIWGPYNNPFTNPMINHTGYTPEESDHVMDSRICGSCHTLITNTVDLEGNPTGTQFVEQAIYHEWLNSGFPANGSSCQSCHLPQITDDVVISSMPPWLGTRSPFGKHHLAGANVFMLKLFKENLTALGITATIPQLDSTIARAKKMLQELAVQLDVAETGRTADSLFVDVSLQNMAGHKFPAGYPSRRVFITLFVTSNAGDTLFASGMLDGEFNLVQEDEGYEPHHSVIDDDGQVQVYELVMGDVDYEPTTVLERAYVPLKDNRIPPIGFSALHPSYDTVIVAGSAVNDIDFNKVLGVEGSGKDIVHYRIPAGGSLQDLVVDVKVYYQTVSARWLEQMFEYTSPEIDAFKTYFEAADKEPVLVASDSFVSSITRLNEPEMPSYSVSPNPAGDFLWVKGLTNLQDVAFFDLSGRMYTPSSVNPYTEQGYRIGTPMVRGIVIVKFSDSNGENYACKVLLQ